MYADSCAQFPTTSYNKRYSLFNESPQVEVRYDVGKNYSPKYMVSFFVEENQQQKVFALLGPLILVAVLTTLNVVNNPPALDNSISLALTIVFLLPEIESEKSSAEAEAPFYKYVHRHDYFVCFGNARGGHCCVAAAAPPPSLSA